MVDYYTVFEEILPEESGIIRHFQHLSCSLYINYILLFFTFIMLML